MVLLRIDSEEKKAVFIGLTLSFLGAILCLSPHFFLLVIGRALQALGAGGLFKLVFTIVADSYSEKKAYKVLAIIMLAFGVIPGVANLLGGYLTQFFTWHSCFIFLLIYIVFLALLSSFLPETASTLDCNALQWERIIHGFWAQFKNKTLILNGLLIGLGTSVSYVFAAQAPFIAMRSLNMHPHTYGLYSLIPAVGLVIGLIFSRQMIHRIRPQMIVLAGIILLGLGSFAIGYMTQLVWLEALLFFIFFGCAQIGNGCIVTISPAQGLSAAKDKSYGAAVLQFFNIGLATVSTWTAGYLIPQTIFWLSVSFCLFVLGMLILWISLQFTPK